MKVTTMEVYKLWGTLQQIPKANKSSSQQVQYLLAAQTKQLLTQFQAQTSIHFSCEKLRIVVISTLLTKILTPRWYFLDHKFHVLHYRGDFLLI